MPVPAPKPPPLVAIPDHELIRPIGRGSYGEVWLARTVMGEYRAVKIIRRDAFDRDRPVERELEGIQKFEPISRTHPHQVHILHVGRFAEGFYYVMELADAAESVSRNHSSVIGSQFSAKTPAALGTPLNTYDCSMITSYTPKTL